MLRAYSIRENLIDGGNINTGKVLKRNRNEFSFSKNFLIEKAQLLLINKDMEGLWEYYKKSPMILAQQFIEDNDSLSENEINRLIYELGIEEREILEKNLNTDNPIFRVIFGMKKLKPRVDLKL